MNTSIAVISVKMTYWENTEMLNSTGIIIVLTIHSYRIL